MTVGTALSRIAKPKVVMIMSVMVVFEPMMDDFFSQVDQRF